MLRASTLVRALARQASPQLPLHAGAAAAATLTRSAAVRPVPRAALQPAHGRAAAMSTTTAAADSPAPPAAAVAAPAAASGNSGITARDSAWSMVSKLVAAGKAARAEKKAADAAATAAADGKTAAAAAAATTTSSGISLRRMLDFARPEAGPLAISVATLAVTTGISLVFPYAIGEGREREGGGWDDSAGGGGQVAPNTRCQCRIG